MNIEVKPPSSVPPTLLPERKGTGLCAEAQGDGVPCAAVGSDCDRCANRPCECAEEAAPLEGIMLPDGLYPNTDAG